MRIIVTGPRGWKGADYYRALYNVMANVRKDYGLDRLDVITLVEGEAEGFDTMAKLIAHSLDWGVERHPVETWYPGGTYNPEAGHMRNQEMVDSGGDIALAGLMWCTKPEHASQDPHFTHGTANCIEKLEDAGIPIVYVSLDGIKVTDG